MANAAPEAMRNFALSKFRRDDQARSQIVASVGASMSSSGNLMRSDFWAAFNGQWLVRDEFHFVDRPRGLPMMEALDRMYGKRPHP